MIKRFLGVTLALAFLLIPLASQAKTFKNTLPRKDWTKYGVNPWRLDTDNDGYPDAWEVKNGYCPTSQDALAIGDSGCEKGSIDFKKEIYKAPAAIADLAAREVKTFGSCAELKNTLATSYNDYYGSLFNERGGGGAETDDVIGTPVSGADSMPLSESSKALSTGLSYSTTNVQVEGVDEGDIIETDGKYIYTLDYNKVNVTKAVPVAAAEVVAEIDVSDVGSARELYLQNNLLTVVGSRYGVLAETSADKKIASNYGMYSYPYTVVQIWSVKNPSSPKLMRALEFQGSLLSSRLKDGYWYGVMNHYINYSYWGNSKKAVTDSLVPLYRDQSGKALDQSGGYKPLTGCANISYVTPVHESSYAEVVAVPINKTAGNIGSKVIFGAGGNIYMSQKNLYLFSNRYNWFWGGGIVPTTGFRNNTEIYKFNIDKTKITYQASQTVPGSVLNQFSADEASGKEDILRLVTTERTYAEPYFSNNLYTFDTDLNRVGWWEGFGGGESIYAARFMGNRAYVVTYKNTDPLFVFDLTNPRAPKKLGELHIPGYSNYLHPYDENHLIGIGKDAVVDESGNFAWYQGMKMALFDVRDPNNPVQMFSTSIGDRGTDSYALYDHHAFLFSKQKNLLAIPVSVSQFTEEQKAATSTPDWAYGTPTYNGLYVYRLDLTNGFQFLGGVSHESVANDPVDYYNMFSNRSIRRSLYIGNYLYAYSPKEISIHNLSDLTTVKEVILNEPATESGVIRTILMEI